MEIARRNKLNRKVCPFLAPINLQKKPFFNATGATTMTIRKATKGSLISHCRFPFFCTATKTTKILLPSSCCRAERQHRYYITKVGHGRKKIFWKVTLPSAKDVCSINSTGLESNENIVQNH